MSITKASPLHFFSNMDTVKFLPIDYHCFWVLEHQHLHVSLTWKSFFKVKSQLQPVRLAARRGCQLFSSFWLLRADWQVKGAPIQPCSADMQSGYVWMFSCTTLPRPSVPHRCRSCIFSGNNTYLTWMLQLFMEPGNADSLRKRYL